MRLPCSGVWGFIDVDGDNQLSVSEFRQSERLFAFMDFNSNGLIEFTEIPSVTRLAVGFGQASLHRWNTDQILRLSDSGYFHYLPQDESGGPLWFQQMDRNRDGEVSRREFLGNQKMFATIDQNQNGFISEKEAALTVNQK